MTKVDPMRNTPPRDPLPWKKRLLFSGIVLVGLILIVEILSLAGLWIVEGQVSFASLHDAQKQAAVGTQPGESDLDEVLHPYLGWVYNPRKKKEANVAGLHYLVNEYGFLETSRFHQRAADKIVIGIVGGSVAWYLSTEGAETLIDTVQQSPDLMDKEVVIVSMAISGYKQPQQLMTLAYVLSIGAEFDVVVNIDGFNEVALHPAENEANKVFIAFPRGWSSRVQHIPDPATASLAFRLVSTKVAKKDWATRFIQMRFRYSPTANLLWLSRDRAMTSSITQDRLALLSARTVGSRYLQTGPQIEYSDETKMYEALALLWKRCSRQLDHICRANDIQYHHFLQPNQYVEGTKPMTDVERQETVDPASPYRKGVVKGYPELVREGADLIRQGVPFHDLTRVFVNTTERIYRDNCCHYNTKGNQMLAELIGEKIVDSMTAENQ